MPNTIDPLPAMLDEQASKAQERASEPVSVIVRYSYTRMVAELPFNGETPPTPGSKLVIRTRRGIEIAQTLGRVCSDAACAKAISRKQMLQFIENSGGGEYPFSDQGKVLRVATAADLNEQARIDQAKPRMMRFAVSAITELDLPMKLADIELLLGGERVIFHYTSEQWVDFRDLVRRLAQEYQTRIEMHQVNTRDEARLVADFEKCGRYCCCKQFLKVLKPVSMKSAKVQKATLDPSKISGRCGRLMCCLRYEDKTYDQLKKLLPHRQTRIQTKDGHGTVIGTQILAQLVLVRLDDTNQQRAFPLDETKPLAPSDERQPQEERPKHTRKDKIRQPADRRPPKAAKPAPTGNAKDKPTTSNDQPSGIDKPDKSTAKTASDGKPSGKSKRRRRRRRRKPKSSSD